MQKDSEKSVVQEKLKDLYKIVHQCQEEREKSEHSIAEVSKVQKQTQKESKMSVSFKTKICNIYSDAIQTADAEAEVLQKALGVIQEIRAIRNERRLLSKKAGHPKEAIKTSVIITMVEQSGQTLPLWVGKPNETPPPLCGARPADPSYIAKIDDMIAVLIGNAKSRICFLAEVIFYDEATKKYEVKDIDVEKGEKVHTINQNQLIPLPLWRANPETNPECLYQKSNLILALYPGSTCFYPGLVDEPPLIPADNYQIIFEDSGYLSGYAPPVGVCQRYVINFQAYKN